MTNATAQAVVFDGDALTRALDERRAAEGLRWSGLAEQLWRQSDELNALLGDDALCPGALQRTVVRGTMTCQYALILLRWLDRAPEEFLVGEGVVDVGDTRLPSAGTHQRLRWDLSLVYRDLDDRRRSDGMTWVAVAERVGCTPSRLTNLKTARLADMDLVMRVTQFLGHPAARYVGAAEW